MTTKVTDDVPEQSGSANTEVSRELAKQAQSEAPSVDDELEKILDRLAVRMYSEGQLDKPSLMGRQVAIVNINEAKSKINRLIDEAEEKGVLKGFTRLDMLQNQVVKKSNA